MVIKRKYKYKKAIILDENNLKRLNKLLEENFDTIKYHGYLLDKSEVNFQSFDELLQYENNKSFILDHIEVIASSNYHKLSIDLGDIWPSIVFNYKSTISYELLTSDKNFEILLREKLYNCFEYMKAWYWWINKFSFTSTLSVLAGALFLIYAIINLLTGSATIYTVKNLDIGFIIAFTAIWYIFLYTLTKGWLWLFPIRQINIGDEKDRFVKIQKTRYWIFGVVFLGIVICIIGNVIS